MVVNVVGNIVGVVYKMAEEFLGLTIAQDIAMWCKTLEEFNLKLEEKIKLAMEIMNNEG